MIILPQMSSYTQQKFRLGTVWGQIGGTTPLALLKTSPGWGLRLCC